MSLQETLSDLARQQVDAHTTTYEVLVVDNSSTDQTRLIVDAMAATYPVPLRYFREERIGKSYALNCGLHHSTAEIIAITDDDVRIEPEWLAMITATFERYRADGIGGPILPLWIGQRPRWLCDRILRQLGMLNYGSQAFKVTHEGTFFIGPNAAYRRSLFALHGGFDERRANSSQDVEWFRRVFRAGHCLIYQPRAVVAHKIEATRCTKYRVAVRFFKKGRGLALGYQERGYRRTIFRIPLWVIRHLMALHSKVWRLWMAGDRDGARWYWFERYYYIGAMWYCFSDWLTRRPPEGIRPLVVPEECSMHGQQQ